MTIAERVGRVVATTEAAGRVNEFTQALRFLMLERGGGADRLAEKSRAPSRVVDFCKAAVTPGATTVGSWGEPLAPFQNLATAFLSSLTGISVFDALWPSMLQAPFRTHVIAVSTTLTAGSIAEASVKPASRLSLTASDLEAVKCAAFLAITQELLRAGTPSALAILQRELRTAMARATNSIFLPILTASAPSFPSSGVAAAGVRTDLRTLLANVSSGSTSALYLIVTRIIAENLAVLADSSGGPAFPNGTVNGGSVGGIPIVVSDEATSGEIILVDASQVAAATGGLVLDTSNQAAIELSTPGDSPVSGSTVMTSLWQANMLAVRAERYIGAKVLRSDAVAKITGVGYTGGSPA